MLNDDENEAAMGETGQRTKVGGVFLRKLGGVGFSAQHRLACQFMMMEKEMVVMKLKVKECQQSAEARKKIETNSP